MIKALDDGGAVQCGAIEALGNLRDDSAVVPLLSLVNSEDGKVRSLAVAALMEITEGHEGEIAEKVGKKRFLKYLADAVSDSDDTVRMSALKGIGQVADPASVPVVVSFLRDICQEDEDSIQVVRDALERINSPEAIIEELRKMKLNPVTEEDSRVAVELVGIAGRIGNSDTVSFLEEELFNVDISLRAPFLRALGDLANGVCLDSVVEALHDSYGDVRKAAAYALGKVMKPCAVAPLLDAIKSEKFIDVKEEIAMALAATGCEESKKAIRNLYESDDAALRELAVKAAGLVPRDADTALLEEALKDSDWAVLRTAINSMTLVGFEADIVKLMPLLDHENEQVRSAAITLIASLGDERSLTFLVRAMSDENLMVRFRAAEALGGLGGRNVYDILVDILEHDNILEKIGAIKALEIMKEEKAIPEIQKLVDDDDEILRDVAREALNSLKSVGM